MNFAKEKVDMFALVPVGLVDYHSVYSNSTSSWAMELVASVVAVVNDDSCGDDSSYYSNVRCCLRHSFAVKVSSWMANRRDRSHC